MIFYRFPVSRPAARSRRASGFFGILPDTPCKVNIISQSINALFYP
nr:MAG TPA: hypothetical protein [Caudoviricetes sp.]